MQRMQERKIERNFSGHLVTPAYDMGREAFLDGFPVRENPFLNQSMALQAEWFGGWTDEMEDATVAVTALALKH